MPKPKRDIDLTPNQRRRVASALVERNALGPCTTCGHTKRTIANRLTYIMLFQLHEAISGEVTEQKIPSVLIICLNCGLITHHALNLLGLADMTPGKESDRDLEFAENPPPSPDEPAPPVSRETPTQDPRGAGQ